MKKLFLTVIASASLLTAPAQLFSPEALGGAMWGSLIGGMAGADCHNSFSGEGAAIGAGVGLLVGALAGAARSNEYQVEESAVYVPAPTVNLGYGYSGSGNSVYVYYSPNAYTAPGYYYRPTQPNYAVSGTLLGAASGALIGAGSDQAGKGAAIGAAAGLVLGSVAEMTTKKSAPRAVTVPAPTQPVPVVTPSTPQDANVQTQEPRHELTAKSGTTSTYTWTPQPQIADASRVPDAPTF